jgi:hypothetical protein
VSDAAWGFLGALFGAGATICAVFLAERWRRRAEKERRELEEQKAAERLFATESASDAMERRDRALEVVRFVGEVRQVTSGALQELKRNVAMAERHPDAEFEWPFLMRLGNINHLIGSNIPWYDADEHAINQIVEAFWAFTLTVRDASGSLGKLQYLEHLRSSGQDREDAATERVALRAELPVAVRTATEQRTALMGLLAEQVREVGFLFPGRLDDL